MGKKLQGNFFLLSANDLKSGEVVFYTNSGWDSNSKKASRIPRDKLEKYQEIIKIEEDKCLIISPEFVELDESGKIKKLRDKIRDSGATIKYN